MSQNTTQIGRPRLAKKYRRCNRVQLQLNDFQKQALDALDEHRVEETCDGPSLQGTMIRLIMKEARALKIGPYSENGQDQ